jgi:hypothetical protein
MDLKIFFGVFFFGAFLMLLVSVAIEKIHNTMPWYWFEADIIMCVVCLFVGAYFFSKVKLLEEK